jgi:hypothetical protein
MTLDLSAFGDLRLVRPLRGGHRNTVWLVETPTGPAVAKSTWHSAAAAGMPPPQAAAGTAAFTVSAFHRTIMPDGRPIEDWLDGPALIDGDEARCDLPFRHFIQIAAATPAQIRAHLASEIITGWAAEPAYAQACADRLAHL